MRKILEMKFLCILVCIGIFAGRGWSKESVVEQFLEQTTEFQNNKFRLINITPAINKWFLLDVTKLHGFERLHLENTDATNTLTLNNKGIQFANKNSLEPVYSCDLWDPASKENILSPAIYENRFPFVALCGGRLFLRIKKPANSQVTYTEWATDLLRKSSYGESVINFFKPFIVNLSAEQAQVVTTHKELTEDSKSQEQIPHLPMVKPNHDEEYAVHSELGIEVEHTEAFLRMGHWYPAKMHKGVYVSLFTNNLIAENILSSFPKRVNPLAGDELNTLAYIVGYDLDMYSIQYAVGVTHPKIDSDISNWSAEKNSINESLVPIGSIPSYMLPSSIGVFVGGFKTRHGNFHVGPYKGKIYGYIENGVELAPMNSELATVTIDKNGTINILEWPKGKSEQEALRENIVSARQNGTFVIKDGEPGEYVYSQGFGGWSGDVKGNLVTLRSGICLQQKKASGKRFLLFFAFTHATPSALARAMQAYQCQEGMQLDMNAHIYLYNALFKFLPNKQLATEFLHNEMHWNYDGGLQRFVMDNNERDFFYILKKNPAASGQ